MDIPALSTAMASSKLAVQVGTAVMSMNKDVMEQQGQALVTLLQASGASASLENSITPYLGGNIDLKV